MKKAFMLALAVITGWVVAHAAEDPVAMVRVLRAESNAAIAVHDAQWHLRSESFVTLSCAGSGDCQSAG